MSTQDQLKDELRAKQKQIWSVQVCEVALAVRHMWQAMANDLGISEDAVQVITNLAKKSGDNTLSEFELARVSDLTEERARAAIDTLVARGWAVRHLRMPTDDPRDRRIQLPAEFIRDVFGYYGLQDHQYKILDQFSLEELDIARRFFEAMARIANDQGNAIKDRRVVSGTNLKATLNGAS
ncbi:hypothetical protein C8D87_11470 [Lentzea atacamensis]|uniref:DNA-binding transcriptional regulator, MarR family n=1 Tax=Lentzea atacamensis TaxID=531938 RepID=A0ABX9DXL9_9PSEU|nr:hypothetical protein [Lentzea atacamensis]RAS59458.1 hypothetical protein C8D87_11470 [Lentzea atacamensis]